MKTIPIGYVNRFCVKESHHNESMKHPCLDNGLVVATNGHTILIAPKERFDNEYHENAKFPNWRNILEQIKPISKSTKIKTVDLFKQIQGLETIPHHDTCEECEGEGKVKCRCCDYTNTCRDCEGKGKYKEANGTEIKHTLRCNIHGKHYNPNTISSVMEIFATTHIADIILETSENSLNLIVKGEDIMIVIGAFSEDDDVIYTDAIKI